MSDDILDLLSGRKTNQEAKGTSSSSNSSYFANKYLNKSNNTSSASSTLKNGNYNSAPTRSGSSGYDEVTDAPLDLMNKFLLCVTENRMKDALDLCDQILEFEPSNKIILEYKSTLREYIVKGLDDKESEDEDGNEEDNEDEDDDNDDDEEEGSDEEGDEGKRSDNSVRK